MDTALREFIFHLSLCNGVGDATIHKIYDGVIAHNLDFSEVYRWSFAKIASFFRLSDIQAHRVQQGLAQTGVVQATMKSLEQHNAFYVTCIDDDYPHFLRAIHLPPAILYYYGAPLMKDQPRLAIVGSRTANKYAQRVIDEWVPLLVARGIQIVSGGARGADTMVHQATLKAGGSTVVVLGSGVLRPYPSENKKLFERVAAEGGTVLSCFPIMTEPSRGLFPVRNRIISGLSAGCLVIQAAAQSGALITAHHALEQGREVFAIPGPLNDPLSEGCHRLIQEGAILVHTVDDLIKELGGYLSAPTHIPVSRPLVAEQAAPIEVQAASTPHRYADLLTFLEKGQLVSLNDVFDFVGKDIPTFYTILSELQCEGLIEQTMNGFWRIKR